MGSLEITAPARLAGFLAALAALFGIGAVAGGLLSPAAPGGASAAASDDAHPTAGAEHGGADPVRGLAIAENGLRLALDTPALARDASAELRFRVLGQDDRVVREFDVEHAKRMHLIVVRRDLTGFQHLHPTQRADGSWSAPIVLPDAGSYRVLADFSHAGEATTLASDLHVDGDAAVRPLPAAVAAAVASGGHRVALAADADVRAGRAAELRFTVTDDRGRPVRTEPYLGAGGHLVALREGDLAFLHVHPRERGADAPDAIAFETRFPSVGRYRLFLQVRIAGAVETVAFTQEVTR